MFTMASASKNNKKKVICNYCREPAELITGMVLYPHRPDLADVTIWRCDKCDAHVGTHRDSDNVPLGRLANAELRGWKRRAHGAFDPLWKRKMEKEGCSKTQARKAGYKWLADQLEIEVKKCHIGMFDVDMCKKVVGVCLPIAIKLNFKE